MNVKVDAQARADGTEKSSPSVFFVYHNGQIVNDLFTILPIMQRLTDISSVEHNTLKL